MVTALKIEPGKNPYPCKICDDEEYLNYCVSVGSNIPFLASAFKIDRNIAVIYCQNGALFSLPGNRRVADKIICGVFYIVRVKNGKLESLTDTDVVKYSLEYWSVERFTEDETIDSWMQ